MLTALLAAGLLGVAGCSAHPGAAAVVGEESIDVQTVDDIAASYCAATRLVSAQQGGNGNAQPTRELRRGVLNSLVQGLVIENAANSLGVDVPAARVQQALGDDASLPPALDPTDAMRLEQLFFDVTRSQLLVEAIGRKLLAAQSGEDVTPEAALDRGRTFVADHAQRLGVEVDPRYGAYTAEGIVVGSGSLSVPVSVEARQAIRVDIDQAWASRLPASQTCG